MRVFWSFIKVVQAGGTGDEASTDTFFLSLVHEDNPDRMVAVEFFGHRLKVGMCTCSISVYLLVIPVCILAVLRIAGLLGEKSDCVQGGDGGDHDKEHWCPRYCSGIFVIASFGTVRVGLGFLWRGVNERLGFYNGLKVLESLGLFSMMVMSLVYCMGNK